MTAAGSPRTGQTAPCVQRSGIRRTGPEWSGGAPRRIDEQTRDWICVIAPCDPRFLGEPSCWSLAKLRDHLIDAGYVVTISFETIRRSCTNAGSSGRRRRRGRPAPTPEFTMRRIRDLYDHPPGDGRVICVDEFGPLNPRPRPGRA
ncbi:helix-turn-helix domain-containing protein [Micromonospora echinofusca]|uniref:helix-turn-helix domain-containing protein n=1 Tax=Micromonospora echinofusca TaxID=47858 RepID=UPI0034D3CFCF